MKKIIIIIICVLITIPFLPANWIGTYHRKQINDSTVQVNYYNLAKTDSVVREYPASVVERKVKIVNKYKTKTWDVHDYTYYVYEFYLDDRYCSIHDFSNQYEVGKTITIIEGFDPSHYIVWQGTRYNI